MSYPTTLEFRNPFQPTCAEVQANLKVYWMTPADLAIVSRAGIETHLGHCDACQEVFVKMTEAMQPDWRNS